MRWTLCGVTRSTGRSLDRKAIAHTAYFVAARLFWYEKTARMTNRTRINPPWQTRSRGRTSGQRSNWAFWQVLKLRTSCSASCRIEPPSNWLYPRPLLLEFWMTAHSRKTRKSQPRVAAACCSSRLRMVQVSSSTFVCSVLVVNYARSAVCWSTGARATWSASEISSDALNRSFNQTTLVALNTTSAHMLVNTRGGAINVRRL